MQMLHTMLRVGNLDRSLHFYCDVLGMRLLRRKDYPTGRFTLAFVGYGDEDTHTVIELTHNWDTERYDLGSGYGHVALGVADIYRSLRPAANEGSEGRPRAGAHAARRHGDRLHRGSRRLSHRADPARRPQGLIAGPDEASISLDASGEKQQDQDDPQEPAQTARGIAPITAVGPGRQAADEGENQHDP